MLFEPSPHFSSIVNRCPILEIPHISEISSNRFGKCPVRNCNKLIRLNEEINAIANYFWHYTAPERSWAWIAWGFSSNQVCVFRALIYRPLQMSLRLRKKWLLQNLVCSIPVKQPFTKISFGAVDLLVSKFELVGPSKDKVLVHVMFAIQQTTKFQHDKIIFLRWGLLQRSPKFLSSHLEHGLFIQDPNLQFLD